MNTIYYPYLRGRQFELIALRELVQKKLIGSHVIPIIEPIKLGAPLLKTVEVFKNANKKYAFIQNPEYGNFLEQCSRDNANKEKLDKIFSESQGLITAYLMNEDIVNKLSCNNDKGSLMIINKEHDDIRLFTKLYGTNDEPKYTLIPDERIFKRRIQHNKILLEDYFKQEKRNADYKKREDDFFSSEHIDCIDDGYSGFSDYSIIGAGYNESGFAPVAVAIHIVYFDEKSNLRIHHFVSDSNADFQDPAGKFGEALDHLVDWLDIHPDQFKTYGLQQFLKCKEKGNYPGLGTVKKYSIMHHLELMEHFLKGREACK